MLLLLLMRRRRKKINKRQKSTIILYTLYFLIYNTFFFYLNWAIALSRLTSETDTTTNPGASDFFYKMCHQPTIQPLQLISKVKCPLAYIQ